MSCCLRECSFVCVCVHVCVCVCDCACVLWVKYYRPCCSLEPPEHQPARVPADGSGQASRGAEEKPGSSGGVSQGPQPGSGQLGQGGPIPGLHQQRRAQRGKGTQRSRSHCSSHGTAG